MFKMLLPCEGKGSKCSTWNEVGERLSWAMAAVAVRVINVTTLSALARRREVGFLRGFSGMTLLFVNKCDGLHLYLECEWTLSP